MCFPSWHFYDLLVPPLPSKPKKKRKGIPFLRIPVEIASWHMKKVKLTGCKTDLTIWKYWGLNGSTLKSQPLLMQIKVTHVKM